MEKPVRINGNEKIRIFNEKVRKGLEHALNFMLGTENENKVQFGAFEPFLMPIESFIQSYKKKSIFIRLFAESAYQGELYWFFEMKTAVMLGGMLRMLPPAALEEKVGKNEFDASDQDAFGEIGNQLSGILDRAFRTLTNKNIHLRMEFKKIIYPDEADKVDKFHNAEEYVVLLSNITIAGNAAQKITLMIPRSLYEVLLNLEIELEGIKPKALLVHSWNTERMEEIRSVMNSRYIKVTPLEQLEDLFSKLDIPNLSAIALDLKTLSFPLGPQDFLFFKRVLSHRAFTRIPLFLSWGNSTDEGVKELIKMGLIGATKMSLAADFPKWAQAFTKKIGNG